MINNNWVKNSTTMTQKQSGPKQSKIAWPIELKSGKVQTGPLNGALPGPSDKWLTFTISLSLTNPKHSLSSLCVRPSLCFSPVSVPLAVCGRFKRHGYGEPISTYPRPPAGGGLLMTTMPKNRTHMMQKPALHHRPLKPSTPLDLRFFDANHHVGLSLIHIWRCRRRG